MSVLSVTFWIQLIAALTIPASILAVVYTRVNIRKPIRWEDVFMGVLASVIPTLLVLALQGTIHWLVLVAGILVVVGVLYSKTTRKF